MLHELLVLVIILFTGAALLARQWATHHDFGVWLRERRERRERASAGGGKR